MKFATESIIFMATFSALRSRFFAPLHSAKRAPLRSGRGHSSQEIQLIKLKPGNLSQILLKQIFNIEKIHHKINFNPK